MERKFDINDRVICRESGVVGKVLRFYVPTSCAEQTMVLTDDGREYHAPTSTWVKCSEIQKSSVYITTGFTMNEAMIASQRLQSTGKVELETYLLKMWL